MDFQKWDVVKIRKKGIVHAWNIFLDLFKLAWKLLYGRAVVHPKNIKLFCSARFRFVFVSFHFTFTSPEIHMFGLVGSSRAFFFFSCSNMACYSFSEMTEMLPIFVEAKKNGRTAPFKFLDPAFQFLLRIIFFRKLRFHAWSSSLLTKIR